MKLEPLFETSGLGAWESSVVLSVAEAVESMELVSSAELRPEVRLEVGRLQLLNPWRWQLLFGFC
jgi:hypothetical protein